MTPRKRTSAGLLMFRKTAVGPEVLLVHPGGPYFQKKDSGAWSIPKGEADEGEDLLTRARIEFEEELGVKGTGDCISLGAIKQKGGKTVHAWAFEGNLPQGFTPHSNTFELEWPPRSGRIERFSEVDQAAFFAIEIARAKINPAQTVLLDRLIEVLDISANSDSA